MAVSVRFVFGSGREQGGGIAGLGDDGTTMIAGMPTVRPGADDAPRPWPEWPLVLILAVVSIVGAYVAVSAEWGDASKGGARDGISGLTRGIVPVPDLPDTATPPRSESLLRRDRLAAALTQIGRRAGSGARVSLLRVDAGQVFAVTYARDGAQRVIRVPAVGATTVNDGGSGPFAGLALSAIDPRVPARIIAALGRDHGVRASRVDYLVASGQAGQGGWTAFLVVGPGKLPRQYHADLAGRGLERVG